MLNSTGICEPINLGSLLSAISLAFDIAESKQLNHARRTAYMAFMVGQAIGLDEVRLRRTLYAGLLHDIGATENFSEIVDDPEGKLDVVFNHPIRGRDVVVKIPGLADVAEVVKYHHERWDGKGYPFGLAAHDIPVEARLIFLADRLDLALSGLTPKAQTAESAEFLAARSGSMFEPELVSAAVKLLDLPRFWLDLDNRNTGRVIARMVRALPQAIVPPELINIGSVFADIIDGRSPYTANHSRGVAEIAVGLAGKMGLAANADAIHTAGLLHDLGKIGVPSAILNKPASLTAEEYRLIQAHPYYTEHILAEVEGLGDVVWWAAMHHERLDGGGYHAGIPGRDISLESRIVAVSDVYQALTAHRPYRRPLTPEEALAILDQSVDKGHLDGEVVAVLRQTVA